MSLGRGRRRGLLALVPPLSTAARHDEFAAALQFSLFAIAVPALVVVGAPWRLFGLAGGRAPGRRPRIVDRIADRRSRHRELPWSLAFIACDLGAAIAWHTPGVVASVTRHGWLVVVEAASLLVFGLGLWLELVASPPLTPRSGHLRRAVLAALAMWASGSWLTWWGCPTTASIATSTTLAGGLSEAADQQIASAVLWFVAAAGLRPRDLLERVPWLQTEEDPDAELLALARAERRRGMPPMDSKRRRRAAPAT